MVPPVPDTHGSPAGLEEAAANARQHRGAGPGCAALPGAPLLPGQPDALRAALCVYCPSW